MLRALHRTAVLAAQVGLLVLGGLLVFTHPHGPTRTVLRLAVAGDVVLLHLLTWSPRRPALPRTAHRSRALRWIGWTLVGVSGLARAALLGFGVFSAFGRLDTRTFHTPLAMAAAGVPVCAVLAVGGYRLAGFAADRALRPTELVRTAGRAALAGTAAGYGYLLAHVGWVVVPSAPRHVYRLVHGWFGIGWLAVGVAIVAAIPWTLLLAALAELLQRLLVALLGRRTPLARWVEENGVDFTVTSPVDDDGEWTVTYGDDAFGLDYGDP